MEFSSDQTVRLPYLCLTLEGGILYFLFGSKTNSSRRKEELTWMAQVAVGPREKHPLRG